jgi:hypothetical protein
MMHVLFQAVIIYCIQDFSGMREDYVIIFSLMLQLADVSGAKVACDEEAEEEVEHDGEFELDKVPVPISTPVPL